MGLVVVHLTDSSQASYSDTTMTAERMEKWFFNHATTRNKVKNRGDQSHDKVRFGFEYAHVLCADGVVLCSSKLVR